VKRPKIIQFFPRLVRELIRNLRVALRCAERGHGQSQQSAILYTGLGSWFAIRDDHGVCAQRHFRRRLQSRRRRRITVMHLAKVSNLWIYLAANFGAGALAALTFKFINRKTNRLSPRQIVPLPTFLRPQTDGFYCR